jgi:gliding motility-associated-like protein
VIAQPAVLAATVAATPVICSGESNGIINVTTTGGTAPYEYSINGGANWQTSNVFNVTAGAYTIDVRDARGCIILQQTTTITEPNILTATATTANATCNGGSNGTVTVTATGGNSNYTYSLNGTTFQASNILNAMAGTYTVTVKDNLGCTTTIPNTVVGLTNDLTFTTPAPVTICEGTSTQLQIVSNALQYAWSPAAGISNPSIANPVANPVVTTSYNVAITYGACSDNVIVVVNVNPAPIANAGADGFICVGQNYQLQGSGGNQFSWTPVTRLTDPTIANPVADPDRTTIYSLIVTDANNCKSLIADNVTVDVTPPIKITTSPADTIVHAGDQFQVLATSVATSYVWSPTTGLNNPSIPNPLITAGAIGDDIIYTVTGTTQAGCRGDGFVRVRVYTGPELYVPTGFTPNGDGKNDRFFPLPVGIKEIKYFRVFNRWGEMIYSTNKLNDGWDGKFAGREQASGVYVWTVEGITKDNRVITKRGTVMLIR